MTNREILTVAFLALPGAALLRLKYHLEEKTPIFCGEGSDDTYYSYQGFG